MNKTMTALYQYILEFQLGPTVQRNPDYHEYTHSSLAQEERLRAILSPEDLKTLDAMLQEQSNWHDAELTAMFQATMKLCWELNGAFLS